LKIIVNEGKTDIEIVINCPQITDDIQKVISMLHGFDKKLLGTKDKQKYIVDSADIFYFETVDKHNFICTENDIFETSLKLYEIEEISFNTGFFRISKAQIVNISKIQSLCPDFGGRIDLTLKKCATTCELYYLRVYFQFCCLDYL
jgi:DNA-binding LytR/AlgR family response regulator